MQTPNKTRFRHIHPKRALGIFLVSLLLNAAAEPARAGGGPENVLLVVNPRSEDSMTIANDYLRLRQIPPSNIFYLPWDPKQDHIEVYDFRIGFLKPILETIRERRLAAQIDYVIYSSNFPWKIYFGSDVEKFKEMAIPVHVGSTNDSKKGDDTVVIQKGIPDVFSKAGSITGMTYLEALVAQNTPAYFNLQANRYMRLPVPAQKEYPTLGFRGSWQFGPQGELVEKDGVSYLLSAMLGVTTGRGNSVEEILKYLHRSARADGTHPTGTIYFVKNDDIRSTVRDEFFPEAVRELKKLGVEAKIVKGTVPIDCPDVQGVCMGTADFNWKASGSTILPGALCEHFTSYGGVMVKDGGQTPLSEFLRYGAAGASGTVYEPYAIRQKFPLPQIQVHYARGCTLAEAYYQSVHDPYQLLIVGDPLCRPWANIPVVEVGGIKNGDTVKGELALTPSATVPRGGRVDRFELFTNGSRAALCKPGATMKFDTTLLPDGCQELRIVAVEDSLIQSQGRAIFTINTANYGRKIEAAPATHAVLRAGEKLKIKVKSPDSIGIGVIHNGRIVGRISGAEGTVEIAADELGTGRIRMQAVGIGNGGAKSHVLSVPMEVEVDLRKKG